MENNIGIGAVVGLVIASSLYIWNSELFSKKQKQYLIICFVFPPVQWLGILIVFFYNKQKPKHALEKFNEKELVTENLKIDSSIKSLKELKERGILSEAEYREKEQKIESYKKDNTIKNSSEYLQLKKLLDNNILTNEEFQNKIELLHSDEIFNKILKNHESEISTKEKFNSPKKIVYAETTDGATLKIISDFYNITGGDIYLDDLPAQDGIYILKNLTMKIVVENKKIKERYFIEKIKGIIIEKLEEHSLQVGDKVFLESGEMAPNGVYSMGFMASKIKVENGKFIRYE